ncbi:MAG: hypothetical protein K0U24_02855 [Gammaproteobacteria bacterium]|nr:hypothetical protein [Gammaproteobacteria bacterium]MCH9763160.1 hypothetical protein [Gammaproteobacteria bacterium]
MMTPVEILGQWVVDAATLIASGKEPFADEPPQFLEEPTLPPALVQIIATIDEATLSDNQALYSACLFALDVCVSQLHFAADNGNKRAEKALGNLMDCLVSVIQKSTQSINFWLPMMGAFYDAQVPLSPALQEMYLALAEEESAAFEDEGVDHIESMRDLIKELADLNAFELAAHFFAQSHAMPTDFFGGLMVDLCSIEEGQDAALLALLHPRADVREMVILALDNLISSLTLSSISLSRLQAIQMWMPEAYQDMITRWLREQRKKGVVFAKISPATLVKMQASEIDGGGAEGVFLQLKAGRSTRLVGMLFKDGFGIKDAWVTPGITVDEVTRYCHDVLNDGVILRRVDLNYICMVTNHFLALTLEKGNMPGLHFLELQEALGVHFTPECLDVPRLIDELSVQIEPFTETVVEASFKRSSRWIETKLFATSWYLENERLDKVVNSCCSFVDGVKTCRFEEAIAAVFQTEMEAARDAWAFHFLWVALWLKAGARKNEKTWQDSLFIAHAIQAGTPLQDIPIMQKICHQSVLNSIETMRDRRTHLS